MVPCIETCNNSSILNPYDLIVYDHTAHYTRESILNIANLAVGHSEMPNLSRMTFVVEGDDYVVEQVTKQLYKLIDVVRVNDISSENIVIRELALIKVRANAQNRAEIIEIADIFRSSIVDVSPQMLIIETTGDEEKIDAMLQLLKPFGIKEVMRTGRVAMGRGTSITGSSRKTKELNNKNAPDTQVIE